MEHAKVSRSTTIRLTDEMILSLKALAEYNGMPYQTYLKYILTLHLRKANASIKKEQAKKKA